MVIYLERGADLHMAQVMPPLPLTISCFSKLQMGFTFLVPAHPGNPGQRAIKQVCVCVLQYILPQPPGPSRGRDERHQCIKKLSDEVLAWLSGARSLQTENKEYYHYTAN